MPDFLTASADNPEFARVIEVARLRRTPTFAFDIAPDAAEAAALARLFGAREVRRLRLHGTLHETADGVALDARLEAEVVQTCVVTLEPVATALELPVRRRFVPQDAAPSRQIDVGPDDDDDDEPLGARIDLGLVAIEETALALPAYPRAEGAALDRATFAAPGVEPLEDEDVKPFAGLAALRDRLGRGG